MLAAILQLQPPSGDVGKTNVTLQVQHNCTTGKDPEDMCPYVFFRLLPSAHPLLWETEIITQKYIQILSWEGEARIGSKALSL